jgi:hypothetical protein
MFRRLKRISHRWWGKPLLAGLAGGVVYAVFASLVHWALGYGPFWFLNCIGATFSAFRPPTGSFAWGPTLVGSALHLASAAVFGLIYGLLVIELTPSRLQHLAWAGLFGASWGVLVWLGYGLFLGPLIDPYVLQLNPETYFLGHVLFGLTTAETLAVLTHKAEIAVTFAPAHHEARHKAER